MYAAPTVNPTPSATRPGNRTTVIVGGFPRDTCRTDLEQGLRIIVDGYEGVLRVGALGRYGNTGRINFKDPDSMWTFIKANKGGQEIRFRRRQGHHLVHYRENRRRKGRRGEG